MRGELHPPLVHDEEEQRTSGANWIQRSVGSKAIVNTTTVKSSQTRGIMHITQSCNGPLLLSCILSNMFLQKSLAGFGILLVRTT